jgi:hypothetical protein
MSKAEIYPPYVPIAYPNNARITPKGVSIGLNAVATIEADAMPPTLACDAIAI